MNSSLKNVVDEAAKQILGIEDLSHVFHLTLRIQNVLVVARPNNNLVRGLPTLVVVQRIMFVDANKLDGLQLVIDFLRSIDIEPIIVPATTLSRFLGCFLVS
jgi:ABC-type arginine transport system permease subunit